MMEDKQLKIQKTHKHLLYDAIINWKEQSDIVDRYQKFYVVFVYWCVI